MPRVHQVLASLGYGDAIGNHVLGIQRVLAAAGFESEIIVESADPRLEARTLRTRARNSSASRNPTRCKLSPIWVYKHRLGPKDSCKSSRCH